MPGQNTDQCDSRCSPQIVLFSTSFRALEARAEGFLAAPLAEKSGAPPPGAPAKELAAQAGQQREDELVAMRAGLVCVATFVWAWFLIFGYMGLQSIPAIREKCYILGGLEKVARERFILPPKLGDKLTFNDMWVNVLRNQATGVLWNTGGEFFSGPCSRSGVARER